MKKLFYFSIVAILMTACTGKQNATINISVPKADSTQIVLSKLSLNEITIEDTLYVKNNKAKAIVALNSENPDFYYLNIDGKKEVSLILKGKDKVNVEINKDGLITISGSEEAALYQDIEEAFEINYDLFHSLVEEIVVAENAKNDKKVSELNKELTKLYIDYKKSALKHVMTHTSSMTTIPMLYRKFSNELPVFSQIRDVLIFKRVYESLKMKYPTSPYVVALADEIDGREQYMRLNDKLADVKEQGYPDITLPDLNAQQRTLSDSKGKVIMLLFWSNAVPEQKLFNLELKKLYKKYSKQGFEIFHVCVDTDKTAWAQLVKNQELPWISVCDGLGSASVSIGTYNVREIPTMYIINKAGDIVPEKNIFDTKKLDSIIGRLVK